MKTRPYDERELTESFFLFGIPGLAWAAIFAFFAFSGAVSHEEPTQMGARQMANVASAPQLMDTETDEMPTMVQSVPNAREPALRDAAVVVHEELDPVGAGLNTKS